MNHSYCVFTHIFHCIRYRYKCSPYSTVRGNFDRSIHTHVSIEYVLVLVLVLLVLYCFWLWEHLPHLKGTIKYDKQIIHIQPTNFFILQTQHLQPQLKKTRSYHSQSTTSLAITTRTTKLTANATTKTATTTIVTAPNSIHQQLQRQAAKRLPVLSPTPAATASILQQWIARRQQQQYSGSESPTHQ